MNRLHPKQEAAIVGKPMTMPTQESHPLGEERMNRTLENTD